MVNQIVKSHFKRTQTGLFRSFTFFDRTGEAIEIFVGCEPLTVSGKRKEEKEEKGKTFHRVERRSGSFSRTITLPCDVTVKEVAAEYTNGVLNVVLPKCDKAKPNKITV